MIFCQHFAVLASDKRGISFDTSKFSTFPPPPNKSQSKFVLAPHQLLHLVCEHIMSTNQADSQSLAFASLQSDVKGVAPPSSASNGGDDIASIGATKDNDHPSPPALPVVTPTDDTKDTILDQPTTIQPPALSPPHHNNVAPSLSSSLTKQALRPPPTSIFPPPSAAVSATSSSVYHHPHADGRKKLGVAIKATANMYGSMSLSAGTFAIHHFCRNILVSHYIHLHHPSFVFGISNSFI